jgi:hypothetical protein
MHMSSTRFPLSQIRWLKTSRLIPSRYPSIGPFDRVATREDLEALIELESWTNDRLSAQLGILSTIPRNEWVVGRPHASVIMAAFCHPPPGGARFSGPDRGAWYAARTLETALAESIHHRTLELAEVGGYETRVEMRVYHADFRAAFHDLRPPGRAFAPVFDPVSYDASQALGRRLLDGGSNGILYRSVRHVEGDCLACFRPPLVANVRVGGHYEFRWEGSPTPQVRPLP